MDDKNRAATLEACIVYNKALIYQAKFDYKKSSSLYEEIIQMMKNRIQVVKTTQQSKLLELGMRSHNNLGHIHYIEVQEDQAEVHFKESLALARIMDRESRDTMLEAATILSNWCRVQWMRGDIGDNIYQALQEVHDTRRSILSWDHVDVASAHYNLGVAEYERGQNEEAKLHLTQYLKIAARWTRKDLTYHLTPINALVYILLMENEDSDDVLSKELVLNLQILQDKQRDLGRYHVDIAIMLNFVGTRLFFQRDLENALLFFHEELYIEENNKDSREKINIILTCNNIGKIFQELGKLPEAIEYYYRALKEEHSPSSNKMLQDDELNMFYSTIWYNLGALHVTLGSHVNAIKAFQTSLNIRKATIGSDNADAAYLLYNIGILQMEQQLLKDAASSFHQVLQIRRVVTTCKLNDEHIVNTLQNLAFMHKAKGDIDTTIEVLEEILHIQENPSDMKHDDKLSQAAAETLREISNLRHAQGDVNLALHVAQQSLHRLRAKDEDEENMSEAYLSELIKTLFLIGSLYDEASQSTAAHSIFSDAAIIIDKACRRFGTSSFGAQREVCHMLASFRCAPQA